MERLGRVPAAKAIASMSRVLPAPVSPVMAISPRWGRSSSTSLMRAKFSISTRLINSPLGRKGGGYSSSTSSTSTRISQLVSFSSGSTLQVLIAPGRPTKEVPLFPLWSYPTNSSTPGTVRPDTWR